MKFVKTLFLAALVAGTAAPAFAEDGFVPGDEGITAAAPSEDAVAPDMFAPRRRPRRPIMHVCYARNAIGRTFSARGWNVSQARYQALRSCRAHSFGPLGLTCRSAGCR